MRLDKQLEAAIARLAKATGSTKSSVVREALLRYVEGIEDVALVAQARNFGGRDKSIAEVRKAMGIG